MDEDVFETGGDGADLVVLELSGGQDLVDFFGVLVGLFAEEVEFPAEENEGAENGFKGVFGGEVLRADDFEEVSFFLFGLLLEFLRSAEGDEFSAVDHGEPVAEFGLVHVMGGQEEGDTEFSGQKADDFPEPFAGERIDAAGRFVEEEDVGQVDHGAGEGDPLFEADRQFVGHAVLEAGEADHVEEFGGGEDGVVLFAVNTAVEFQVFMDFQVAVEGEFLRHVADPVFEAVSLAPDMITGDEGVAAGGVQNAEEHFDGGGFSGPVGAEEAEDFAGVDVEADVIDGGETAEIFGQFHDADDRFVFIDGEVGGFLNELVHVRADRMLVGQVGEFFDEDLAEFGGFSLGLQVDGVAFEEDAAVVDHGDAVTSFGLVEVTGGDDDGDFFADDQVVDDNPQIAAGDRIYAGGGFIEDEDSRVMDEGTAEGEFLLHSAGELTGESVLEIRELGNFQELLASPADKVGFHVVQVGEKFDILADGEFSGKNEPEALGHESDQAMNGLRVIDDIVSENEAGAGGGPGQAGNNL